MVSHAHAIAAQSLGMPIEAVASRSRERAERRAVELGTRAVEYAGLPASADIVIVATPPARHFDDVVHSLERGAAVVVEKPLVTTLNEADRLVTIAERYANKVLYAENLAYAPAFRKWILHLTNMGAVQHLSVRMEQGSPSWGDFLDPAWGGGVLFDLGVHPLALMVLSARACGAGEVVAVSAVLDGDTTDELAEVVLTFSGGICARTSVSWRGSDTPHWSLQAASESAAITLELMPEIALEHNGDPVALASPTTQPPMIESLGYLDQLRAFRVDIADGVTPWMDVAFGRWILEIVCACYVSARDDGRGTPVPSGCDRTLTPWQLWRG